MIVSDRPNRCWSLGFVSDAFTDCRRFRVLTIVDDHTRVRWCRLMRQFGMRQFGGLAKVDRVRFCAASCSVISAIA